MVRGLERFREHFADFVDRYLIIGGTACDLALTEAGLEFRATRDIDIVLCVESVDAAFGKAFWSFVKSGAYESLEAPREHRKFYRFAKPGIDGYPMMLELFSGLPDVLDAEAVGHLVPIPISDEVSSLLAILLDAAYDRWIRAGRVMIGGLPVVRPEHLIPLKARAWLDLTARVKAGQRVDSRDIRKHRNDVFRLHAIIDPEYDMRLEDAIRSDMERFMTAMRNEAIDLRAMGLGGMSLDTVLDELASRYVAAP